jgi:hypothetical protein
VVLFGHQENGTEVQVTVPPLSVHCIGSETDQECKHGSPDEDRCDWRTLRLALPLRRVVVEPRDPRASTAASHRRRYGSVRRPSSHLSANQMVRIASSSATLTRRVTGSPFSPLALSAARCHHSIPLRPSSACKRSPSLPLHPAVLHSRDMVIPCSGGAKRQLRERHHLRQAILL